MRDVDYAVKLFHATRLAGWVFSYLVYHAALAYCGRSTVGRKYRVLVFIGVGFEHPYPHPSSLMTLQMLLGVAFFGES